MAEGKPTFAAIPARCIGDERLAALDLRVLAAIAMHDRFSKNGVGCTIGHGKLAAKLNCHLKSLSRSIRTLAECGYVGGRDNPLNPKYRAYFVIYNEFDEHFTKAPTGNELVTPTGSETVTSNASRGNQLVPESAARGNQLLENA
ncbi:hypothetical protein [Mesorhizobium sp. CN2-181]|uniref:hypothetical protein n=1 Tax=Mesorhizobium yinganensis TaxID=3157707 RepID=UPI0032B800F5